MAWRVSLNLGLIVLAFVAPAAHSSNTQSLSVFSLTAASAVLAGDECLAVIPCTAAGGCVPIPTTLVPIDVNTPGPDWDDPGGACGTTRCFIIFRCPCGPPLATRACL